MGWKTWVKRSAFRLAYYSGLELLIAKTLPVNAAAILMYHGVCDNSCLPGEVDFHLNVPAFERHMRMLKRRYPVVPLETLLNRLERGERLRKEIGKDAQLLADEVWSTTELLDKLGMHTIKTFQKAREEVITRQQQEMLELSTPVVKLWEGILALPIIGTLEMDTWCFENGGFTIPVKKYPNVSIGERSAGGLAYFNIGPGLRAALGNRVDMGGALTWAATGNHWGSPWFRLEVRFLF